MQLERPYILSIAGFDPSGGAGVLADVKTFEQLGTYGLAVCTGMTLQTEDEFISVKWRELKEVTEEIKLLLRKYPVKAIKFGIVPSFDFLNQLVSGIRSKHPDVQIVVDPIWRSSTGFTFNKDEFILEKDFLEKITLITPNVPEFDYMRNGKNEKEYISEFCKYSNLLLKGGHSTENIGIDVLYKKNSLNEVSLLPKSPSPLEKGGGMRHVEPKHGSGCVLSAAITAQLGLGNNLEDACRAAKQYTEEFLISNDSLLGFHA
jgi:hydroxymethylpyrimidine/phosphomethylpyrimidine kinase